MTRTDAFLNLIASEPLRQNRELLVGALDFGLVVQVLVLVDQDFLEALILDLFVVHEQVLQLLVQIGSLLLPAVLPVSHILPHLFSLFLSDALLGLELAKGCLQVRLRLLHLSRQLLQLGIVFLQRVKFQLLRLQTLLGVLQLVLELLLMVYRSVTLLKVPFRRRLYLLELVTELVELA